MAYTFAVILDGMFALYCMKSLFFGLCINKLHAGLERLHSWCVTIAFPSGLTAHV